MLTVIVVGGWWLLNFIREKTQFITMASLASYYFSSTRYKEGSASVSTAFKFAYMKHAGSLALGGLLLTLIEIG
jgi:hypothetical protein